MSTLSIILEELRQAAGLTEAMRPSPKAQFNRVLKFLKRKGLSLEVTDVPGGKEIRVIGATTGIRKDLVKLFLGMGLRQIDLPKVTYPSMGFLNPAPQRGLARGFYMEWDSHGYLGIKPLKR